MHTDDPTNGIHNPYEKEAQERWGNTDAYKQSQERVKKMTKEEFARIGEEGDILLKKIAALKEADPASSQVQELIAQHYNGLRHFYEPSPEMYRGLGDLYVDDPRFAAFFDKYGEGMAAFMKKAMHTYSDGLLSA